MNATNNEHEIVLNRRKIVSNHIRVRFFTFISVVLLTGAMMPSVSHNVYAGSETTYRAVVVRWTAGGTFRIPDDIDDDVTRALLAWPNWKAENVRRADRPSLDWFFENGIEWLSSCADDDDVSLIYIAAHGGHDWGVDKEPKDDPPRKSSKGTFGDGNDEYIHTLTSAPTDMLWDDDLWVEGRRGNLAPIKGTIIFILETCWSGGWAGKGTPIAPGREEDAPQDIGNLAGLKERVVALQSGEASRGSYGCRFTYILLEGIDKTTKKADKPPYGNDDGSISAEEAFNYAKYSRGVDFIRESGKMSRQWPILWDGDPANGVVFLTGTSGQSKQEEKWIPNPSLTSLIEDPFYSEEAYLLADHLYFKTILNPDAALMEFLQDNIDAITDLIRTSDIDTLDADGAIITSTPGFHMCYIGSNLRLPWMGPQDGGEPGRSLRQAMAHLLPKDALISTLFRYIVVRIDTFVPPSLEEWYNPDVPIYDYNPDLAYQTLVDGGWVYDSGLGTWRHPATGAVAGGEDATIQVLCPLEIVAPTSFTIVGRYVDEMNALTDPDGNPTPLAAVRQDIDFWEIVVRAFQTREFEQYFGEWDERNLRFPNFLYKFFHSAYDIEWGDNSPGIHNDDLDDLLEIVQFGMDHDEKVQAAKDAQYMLAETQLIMPIYSRNYFSAHQLDNCGMVLKPGSGIDNFWTFINVGGPRQSTLVTIPNGFQLDGTEVIWALGEHVESYNPAEARTIYAWTILRNIHESLLNTDPYTLENMPWLAQDWVIHPGVTMTTPHGANMVDGMYIEFTLDDRVVEGKVHWHDGEVWDANDIMFSWQYIWDNELTNYVGFWETLIDIDNPNPWTVVAYWNEPSPWVLYDAADTAALFAPQVWGYIDTDSDGDNYLADGDIEGDISIRAYQPEDHLRSDLGAYPAQPAFQWLTQAIGIGPYVLYSASEDGYHTNLVAFDLGTHQAIVSDLYYGQINTPLMGLTTEMFYLLGDVTVDGLVDTVDLASIGLCIFQTGTPFPPSGYFLGFIQEDVVPDGIINILDLATTGKNFGKVREY